MTRNFARLSPEEIAGWPRPNYVDPETRDWMPIYAGILYAVTTFMTGTRLWLRAYNKHAGGFGFDDALLLASWLFATCFNIVILLSTEEYMVNRHMWDVPSSMYEPIALLVWIAELTFLLASCCVKVSVLLFYRRLVNGLFSRYWVWALLAGIGFIVAYTLSFILTLVFDCTPTNATWRSLNPAYTEKYHCVDTIVNSILSGVLAAVTDLFAVALPMLMTRNFTMAGSQKLALNLVFSLGFLVVAASIVRTYYLYEVAHQSDVTSYIFDSYVWSVLELELALICTSAPALRSLFRDHLSRPWAKMRQKTLVKLGKPQPSSHGAHGFPGTHHHRFLYQQEQQSHTLEFLTKPASLNVSVFDLEASSRSSAAWSDPYHQAISQGEQQDYALCHTKSHASFRQDSASML